MKLFYDIETSPNLCYVWETGYKQNVPTSHIVTERAVICVCYRWENEKRVNALTWSAPGDDKQLVKQFIDVVGNRATELVAHYGDRFDLPWLRGRALRHGLTFPVVPTVDTCLQSRRLFKTNSSSLDYLAKFLGVGSKMSTGGFDLWRGCMAGRKNALAKMVAYCKHDVEVLQSVYNRLRPYLTPKVHAGVAATGRRTHCAVCGSDAFTVWRKRVTAAGMERVQLRCKTCGAFWSVARTHYETEIGGAL